MLERIDKLEAETNVLRRYLKAVISLLPNTQPINGVFAEEHRRLNADAIATYGPIENPLQKANASFGYSLVPKYGHLKS